MDDYQRRAQWLARYYFSGICTLVAITQLVPGAASLRVEGNTLTITTLFRRATFHRADFTKFFPVSLGTKQTVGFNYAPGYTQYRWLRSVNVALSGGEGAFPDTYGHDPDKLAAALNRWLAGKPFDIEHAG